MDIIAINNSAVIPGIISLIGIPYCDPNMSTVMRLYGTFAICEHRIGTFVNDRAQAPGSATACCRLCWRLIAPSKWAIITVSSTSCTCQTLWQIIPLFERNRLQLRWPLVDRLGASGGWHRPGLWDTFYISLCIDLLQHRHRTLPARHAHC